MEHNEAGKMKMCYLFLSLDGPMNEANLAKFEQVGQNYEGFAGARDSIIWVCNQFIGKSFDQDDYYDAISEGILTMADSLRFWDTAKKEAEQKQCLWMLVNLAYYDGQCTHNERQILRTLMRKWEIDKSVLLEMEDTAEALLALDKQRSWVKTTHESYDFVNSVVQELDKNQTELIDNISDVIAIG